MLIVLVLVNIIGDVGNVGFWWADASSREASLNTGIIATTIGAEGALIAGTIILLLVALVYIAALFGLFKKWKWAPLLVIAVSVANRLLALFLYLISPAFAFWAVWTIILAVVSYVDYCRMATPNNA